MTIETVTLTALREYVQPTGVEDEYPHEWAEYFDPERIAIMGCGTQPGDDPGERIPLHLTPEQARQFIADWHGAIWDVREGEYGTDCYRTGRESMDVLFIKASSDEAFNTAVADVCDW
jgi:hypothetical protein